MVGVDTDDKTGVVIRPVEGIPIEEIDDILQDMVGYNNKIAPYYMPRTSTEEMVGLVFGTCLVSRQTVGIAV